MKEKKEKQHIIFIRASEDDYEEISRKADIADETVTCYVRDMALNGKIVKVDYDPILEHSKQIKELKDVIKRLVYTSAELKVFYAGDIQKIDFIMNEIQESEKKLINLMKEYNSKLTKKGD